MFLFVLLAIGAAGALFSHRLPMSGKAAMGAAAVPLLGFLASAIFC